MFLEYGLYYAVCSIAVVVCVLILLPVYVLVSRLVLTYVCDGSTIGSIITLIVVVSTPFTMYSLVGKTLTPYRDSFVKNFTPGIYKEEVCRNGGQFPIYIGSGVTEEMELCFPVEAKIKRKADAWFNNNHGRLMSECEENAFPRFKYRCNEVVSSFYVGMFPHNFKYSTLEDMIKSGQRQYDATSGITRQGGVYY